MSGDDPLLGSQMASFCCVLTWWKLRFKQKNSVIFKKFENELARGLASHASCCLPGTRMSNDCVPKHRAHRLSQRVHGSSPLFVDSLCAGSPPCQNVRVTLESIVIRGCAQGEKPRSGRGPHSSLRSVPCLPLSALVLSTRGLETFPTSVLWVGDVVAESDRRVQC